MQFISEPCTHRFGGGAGSTEIVVEKDECDVVPILCCSTRSRSCHLGEQETRDACDIHLDGLPFVSNSGRQGPDVDIPGGKSGASQIGRAEAYTPIKMDRRTLRLIIEVRQQFELHDNRGRMPFCHPSPDAVAVGLELGTHERLLESCRADRTGGDLEIDLHVNVCGARMPPATACAQQFRH